MRTHEITAYDQWQLEKYGNIILEKILAGDNEEYENGQAEAREFSEWIEKQADHANETFIHNF